MPGAALPSPRLLGVLAVRCCGPEPRGRALEPPARPAVPSAAPCAACRGEDAGRGWASGVGAPRADLTSGRGAWVVPPSGRAARSGDIPLGREPKASGTFRELCSPSLRGDESGQAQGGLTFAFPVS